MYIQKFQSAAGSKITVTTAAANIFDLINTAQSTALNNAGFTSGANAIIIQPEDGDIRVLFGELAPTSSNGFLISSGTVASLPNIPLNSLQLISAGASSVVCSIQVGVSDSSESITIGGSGGASAAYDPLTTSDRVTILNPLYAYNGALLQEDFTNLAATYTRYITKESNADIIVQFDKTTGTDTTTFKIYGSLEDNGTADSSASYVDITQFGTTCLTSAAAASFTADCALKVSGPWKFIKIEITISGGANDADGSVFARYAY